MTPDCLLHFLPHRLSLMIRKEREREREKNYLTHAYIDMEHLLEFSLGA